MSINVTFNSANLIPLSSEFFMARRPVMDGDQHLVAHELLFCETKAPAETGASNSNSAASPARPEKEDEPAGASVIEDVHRHGMSRVVGDLLGILYIDAQALTSDVFRSLPPHDLLLELAEMPEVTLPILDRIAAMKHDGFRFALALHDDRQDVEPLLPMIEMVRIDISGKDRGELDHFCQTFRARDKKLLAERVDTHEQFRMCHELGFDLFQGYYFTRPRIINGKKLSPSQIAITELMALVASDADSAAIEEAIKSDVALGLNLLRLANTPAFSVHRIDSLRQALMVLGRQQLQRWLQILLCAAPGSEQPGMMPLLAQATMRGRLMELIAQKARPGNRNIADTAFTVGIMSLMDALFSMSMETVLQQVPVIEEVSDALLHRQGYYGKLLSLAEYTEWQSRTDTLLQQAMLDMKLSYSELYMLQLAAFEWSDHVTRTM
ncbi:EAL domain-containing protein [Noviherbaspirillum agri]